MKLIDLFEREEIKDLALASLTRRLRDAKAELRSVREKGATTVQGSVAPQYKAQFDRAQRAVKAVEDEISRLHSSQKAKDEARQGEKEIALKHASMTKEDKKKEFSDSVKKGQEHAKELKGEEGNVGLVAKIKKIAKELTVDGKEKLNAEQLAKKLGVPTRTLYKYLEMPGLHSVQSMLPMKH